MSQLIFVTHIIASNCTPGTQSDASHVSIYIFDVYYYLYMRIDERRVIHVDAEDELEATAVSHCVDAKALFAQFDASRRAQARCDHTVIGSANHSTKNSTKHSTDYSPITAQITVQSQYNHITSQHTALHCIASHYITIHYITTHYITLHHITLH